MNSHLTVNYGLRWDTTFGLFEGSGRSQLENPAFITLKALGINLIPAAPHDYRKQFGPRLGLAYSPGRMENTVFRASFGIYYNDLAQNGWVGAFQAVNAAPGPCTDPANDPGLSTPNAGCLPGATLAGKARSSIQTTRHRTRCMPALGCNTRSMSIGRSALTGRMRMERMRIAPIRLQAETACSRRSSLRTIRRRRMWFRTSTCTRPTIVPATMQ